MFELNGKVAVVTGAAQGIGKASAAALAKAGANVLLADLNGPGVEAAAAEIGLTGGEAMALEVDVRDEHAVEGMIAAAVDRWGRLDTLMNNAHSGQIDDIDIVTTSRATWDKTFAGTLFGVVYGCKYAVPAMIKGGGGSIINVSSNAVLGGDYIRVAYGAAKAGVASVTRYTAATFGKEGIRCNTLSPGVLVTPAVLDHYPSVMREVISEFVSAPRMGEPEDAAGLVVYLASDAAAFINGQFISVDGGLSTPLGPSVELKRRGVFAS